VIHSEFLAQNPGFLKPSNPLDGTINLLNGIVDPLDGIANPLDGIILPLNGILRLLII
jgi:hypothetical protein